MRCVKSSLLASENKFKEDKNENSHFLQLFAQALHHQRRTYRAVRRFIYSFKRGDRHAVDFAINIVSECLNKWYGASNQDYVLVCVPAATNAKYNRRFKRFAEEVSKRTGIQNGTAHVNIFGMRETKHNNAAHIVSESYGYHVSTDPDFFAGKNVILFDNLITTGATAEEFAEELAAVDANVIGGLFLARTKLIRNL